MVDNVPHFNYGKCIRCYCCHEICPQKAIHLEKPIIQKFIDKARRMRLKK